MSEQPKKVEVTIALPKVATEPSTESVKTPERKDNADREERKEIREAAQKEKERKESVDSMIQQGSRDRAEKVLEEYNKTFKYSWDSLVILKKIALVLLVIIEIIILTCWVHNPTSDKFEELIAPILFVTIIFSLILLLGNVIAKEDREIAIAKSEMMKEIFMRRLK